MNENFILALIFGVIFAIEAAFPFILKGRWNRQHLAANASLLIANALVGLLFGPITAFILGKNTSTNNIFHLLSVFLLFDGWMYLWHRLNHRVPFFWRFHQVHHSDTALDTTTTFRFHPGEICLSHIFNLAVFAILGMSASHLLSYKVIFWGVIIFHHSNTAFPLTFDRFLRRLIVTPFMHRIHHSPLRPETDSNYGSVFSFWDKLFKSYRVRDQVNNVVFGLDTLGINRVLNTPEVFLLPLKKI